jgi:hypothetical protein
MSGALQLPTVNEVASLLNVSRLRVYELARGPLASCVVRLGRQIRFHPIRLQELIDSGGFELPGGWRVTAPVDGAKATTSNVATTAGR